MRRTTISKLAPLGCHCEGADDGATALEVLAEAHFDLVIMDINMPLDGYETTRRIRLGAVPVHAEVPIVGYSSNAAAVASVKARHAGMNGFMSKPCTALEIAQVATQILEASLSAESAGPPVLLAGKTVLVADDSSVNRSIIKAYLMLLGIQVIEAGHGAEVLQAIHAGARPDAILMDMNMPGSNGVETTKALRVLPSPIKHIPIIALTSNSSQQHMDEAQAAGMNGYLNKPVDVDVLRTELSRLLGATTATRTAEPASPLLDMRRIRNFDRMGSLELLGEFLDQMSLHEQRLEKCVKAQDHACAREALHSMVGLSGEAGAQALHQVTTRLNRTMEEGGWPQDTDWMTKLSRLMDATTKAVNNYREGQNSTRVWRI